MQQKFIALLLSIFIFSTENIYAAFGAHVESEEYISDDEDSDEIKLFAYDRLAASGPEMVAQFKRTGYIAISGVPGFAAAYQQFLAVARQFTALPPEAQAECTPADYFAKGWSRGVEVFDKKTDTYKGSYYAWIPDRPTNIWPTRVPEFGPAYQAVARIIMSVGQEILPLVGFAGDTQALARMLHYKSVPAGEDDGNPNWCGVHRDHGILTGLCPEVFYKDGKVIRRPKDSGLYIEGTPVAPPADIVLFQMGEVLELMSNGDVRATDHWVRKAYDGSERFAMAVFFDPLDEVVINCSNSDVIAKYADRFEPGISYEEWGRRSLLKYNPKELAPTAAK